ncbi:hypothetical protein E2C01_031223 [Portunus trituberculatus]|uniref:Uncharacterized protein n=1 Tax=Portunus trituberculatus TaxID=210409 RepID=A0A5B7EY15_PORTR|nr:hypothetical protein [Portunus trituberculatus]
MYSCRCRESRTCSGFVVDYSREACFPLSPVFPPAGPNPAPRPADYAVNYFQKICLSGPTCGKAWMLERVVGFEIEGYDDLVLNDVATRLKCAELCLGERNLRCRSAEYHERDRVCRLSRQDRRTQPLSFRPSSPHVHYIENQCAGIPLQQNCEFEEFLEQDIFQPDLQLAVESKEQCQEACEAETSMNCRSYTWVARAGVCRLSGDDMISSGLSAILPSPGVTPTTSYGIVGYPFINLKSPSAPILSSGVYGILARNLVARSGDNSDSIVLLDERGCPADPAIFPSLQPIPNSRSLQGKFEAFKFSEDQVVRFQVNVQFCLEECRPAQCGNIVSYGKRRRRSLTEGGLVTLGGELTLVGGEVTLRDVEVLDNEDEEDDHVYHEMPLQKEILVESSSVKPLKSGLLPEETDARRIANLVCTSREVLIAMVVSAVILQICIILIAIMCVFARRRRKVPATEVQQGASSLTLSRGYRSPYTVSISEDSANTLKTLRTSLRD